MNNSTKGISGGVGFCGLLTIAFVVLKLTNVISWSWWWVISPIWIPLGVTAIALTVILTIAGISGYRSSSGYRRRKRRNV